MTQQRGQKALITLLSFATMIGITWALIQPGLLNPGLRSILTSFLQVSCFYFFFQVYNAIVSKLASLITGQASPTSFVLEFLKFFFTLATSFFYATKFFSNRPMGISGLSELMVLVSSIAILAAAGAVFIYRFRLVTQIALKSRVAQAEAQYSLLESQMQPHFLFNSLNVLSELIYVDPDMANAMSQKLADLYREILNNSKNKFSTLDSELSILEKYVDIQKIRFGERIRFSMDVSPAFLTLQVPSLMLQTLVENAIKHGISPCKDGGEIDICVVRIGSLFEVTISNTGELYKGHSASNKRSTGLQNTRNRLDLMYGEKHNFQIYSDERKTYVKFLITGRSK